MLESAVVKFFASTKGYGFLTIPGERDMFFHIKDGRKVGENEHGKPVITKDRLTREPAGGQRLRFKRAPDPAHGGFRALPWVLETDYDAVGQKSSTP